MDEVDKVIDDVQEGKYELKIINAENL